MRRGAPRAARPARPDATSSTASRCRASHAAAWLRASGCASNPPVVEDSAMATPAERIGFLGLGIMGSRMDAHVARAGYELSVWTHTPGKAAGWAAEHGASAHDTPAAVAAASDIVFSMVVDEDQVAGVMLGEEGVAAAGRPGLLAVDCSTIGPAAARRIGEGLRA